MMKHTDFNTLHRKLDEQAREELIAAVRAHGGEYVFVHVNENGDYDDDESADAPTVLACTYYWDEFDEFVISRVELREDKYLSIYGWHIDNSGNEIEIDVFAHGQLENIIEQIPETENIKSVTIIPPKPILVLSPEDVECVGYRSDMSVSQFDDLKRLMEKSFEWNMDIFWDALRQACENVGIEPLNKNDEDEED